MSYLSFSNSMNAASECCPLNHTLASALLEQSASDSLQQCLKQTPFSPLPSSLTLLCTRSPSLPLSGTHRRKFPGSHWLLRLSLTEWGLLCGRQRLGCVCGHRSAPRKAAAAQNTARSRELTSMLHSVHSSPTSPPFFFLVSILWEAWKVQFYLGKCVWN